MQLAIWTAILHEMTPPAAVRALAGNGWQALELSTEHIGMISDAEDPRALADETRATADEVAIAIPQVHLMIAANVATADNAAREHDLAVVEQQIALSSRMGVDIGVIHPGGDRPATFAEELAERERRFQSFRRLADHAAQFDFALAIENTVDRPRGNRSAIGCRRYGATIEELHTLIDAVHRPNVGICLDVGHGNVQGFDMAEAVRQCGDRLIATHIQDNDGLSDQHLGPARGAIDWEQGIAALNELGYRGLFNLEIPGERVPTPELCLKRLEGIRETAEWLLDRHNRE